jgi:Uncharacterized conserved protein
MPDNQLIGLVAATLTTFSFVPQVVKIWRTRRAEDISLPAFSIFATGVFLWLVYGILRRDLPLILANAVTFLLAASVLILTLSLRSKRP